jgi:hypothetical protein
MQLDFKTLLTFGDIYIYIYIYHTERIPREAALPRVPNRKQRKESCFIQLTKEFLWGNLTLIRFI